MKILAIADPHIGSIKDTSYYYSSFTNIIDQEIVFKHCDMIVILGDYFDRLFKVNEEYVSLAINIMSYLVRVCIKSKTKIRIVYGTESHEMNQYRLFNHFLSSSTVDMKLFTTCTEEVVNGKKILYVPEEYISSKYDFYKNTIYGDKKYDYIFGHGVISEGMPMAVGHARESDNINTENKVPHFNAGELSKAAKLVLFGHYHRAWNVDNVYYVGSLYRWCFGEEEDKRYALIEDDKVEFITNKDAYTYKTYEYTQDSAVYHSSDDIMNEIAKIKANNSDLFNGKKVGKIRLIFHTPSSVDPTFKENLKTLLFNDKVISSLIKETAEEKIEESSEIVKDEYDFILDTTMNVPDKILNYIMKTYDECQLSLKEIEKYINDPLVI